MMGPFELLRILGGRVGGLALVLLAGSAETEGWRDKRRGTAARHVVVVDRESPCRSGHHSAGPHSKHLKSRAFRRVATNFCGAGT